MITTSSQGSRSMAHQLDDLLERWKLRRETDKPKRDIVAGIAKVRKVRPLYDTEATFEQEGAIAALADLKDTELVELRMEIQNNLLEVKLQRTAYVQEKRNNMAWWREAETTRRAYVTLLDLVIAEGRRRKEDRIAKANAEATARGVPNDKKCTPPLPPLTPEERVRKDAYRAAFATSFGHNFARVAEEMLPPEQFAEMVRITRERVRAELEAQGITDPRKEKAA